jgi:hypothetical protein
MTQRNSFLRTAPSAAVLAVLLGAVSLSPVLLTAPTLAATNEDNPPAARYPAPVELPPTPELAPAPAPMPSPGWAPIPVSPSVAPNSSASGSSGAGPNAAGSNAPGSNASGSGAAGSTTPGAGDPSAEDIRDIRGPKDIVPFWILPALIAAVVLLALAAYALWRWRRRRRSARPLLPFEIALQRLEQIRPLMQPASVREFSIAITDIVRQYIEQRFQVTAAHRTTEEFLHDLLKPSQGSLAAHRALLEEFLHQCDLAKFAGMSLSRESMETLYQSARTFVLQTAKPGVTPEETRAALPAT